MITCFPAQKFPIPGNIDLQMLLSKRPRERESSQRPPKIQVDNKEQETKQLTKLAMDFKNKVSVFLRI